jgi:hypothetical protein
VYLLVLLQVRGALHQVLESDEDLAAMYLSVQVLSLSLSLLLLLR